MKQNTGRISAFMMGFFMTILLAVLVAFVLISLYRMENTISANGYTVLNVEGNSENKIKVVAFDKEYIFNFDKSNQIIKKFSTYDVLIPSEVRAFFCVVKSSIGAVEEGVCAMF